MRARVAHGICAIRVERECMAIKLVLSDIDGTLLPRGNAEVDRRVVEAFHALLDAGLAVGPASGRALARLCWRRGMCGNSSCHERHASVYRGKACARGVS